MEARRLLNDENSKFQNEGFGRGLVILPKIRTTPWCKSRTLAGMLLLGDRWASFKIYEAGATLFENAWYRLTQTAPSIDKPSSQSSAITVRVRLKFTMDVFTNSWYQNNFPTVHLHNEFLVTVLTKCQILSAESSGKLCLKFKCVVQVLEIIIP